MLRSLLSTSTAAVAFLGFANLAVAHEHHTEAIPENAYVSNDPIDTILWLHIACMTLAFGIIFPTGMVLGLSRSRWHVPLQSLGAVLAVVGYFLAHHHKGREFKSNIHAKFAPFVIFFLLGQVVIGVYLKLHLEKCSTLHDRLRTPIVFIHGVIGKIFPIISWIQIGFGAIAGLGFCREDHLGQCLAHGIMGSSFIAYGAVMSIMLLVGQPLLARTNRSQEFFDSALIGAWGCVNTFTEHRWGHEWNHGDYQHTSMGVIWWCAGILGVLLSRRGGKPTRNIIPGLVIFLTGWAMSSHVQHLEVSSKLHATFGYTLMAAGLARIIEVAFLLRDESAVPEGAINSFQYLPPFLLVASGILFMGANEEQMAYLNAVGIEATSYTLILYSAAFLIFSFIIYLINLWSTSGRNAEAAKKANGNGVVGNGHVRDVEAERRAREAEEYELGALLHDDDDEGDEETHKRTANGVA
ncbi:hypothetical protein YB2330_002239 [Saitoella coloradoensis]